MNVLNVAEKPSVAKSVSTILSRNQGMRVREGRSRYNKIFEFNYTIRGQPCHMLFTSVTGHLMELEFEERYRKWHACDPADLYQAPVHKSVPEVHIQDRYSLTLSICDKKDIKRTLEEEARRCQWLVLWLDCDREGENIAFEVVDVCTAANRHLTIKRARFSALIDRFGVVSRVNMVAVSSFFSFQCLIAAAFDREIHQAVQNLVEPNKWFADAVDARQEIDLRIGASFTRFQTMLMKDAFIIDTATDDRKLVLSYGPCQFPTLGFVVERYWEIQAHEPEEFWSINCSHKSDEGIANFSWMLGCNLNSFGRRGHLFDYTCAAIIYEMCIEEPTATVTNIRQQEKLKYPPHPLNTIELEKRASRFFRMSSEHTMKVAEELYQAGFISYPRTETDNFSSRTDLHTIVQEQQGHPEWGIYAQRLLDPGTGLWRNPRGGGHDDNAHPPIHPTKFSTGESGWSQDHHKLYELVVRHFLACISKPAVGAETIVEIDIAGELFSASGRVILEKNYLDVYRYESWGGSMIPTYNIGQQQRIIYNILVFVVGYLIVFFLHIISAACHLLHVLFIVIPVRFLMEFHTQQIPIYLILINYYSYSIFIPTTLTLDSGVTRPPPLLSEADLLSCMDKEGIGTDATMHDHIKKLLDRFYATKDANTRFTPTNLGEALVMGYDDMGYKLWKPYLRAVMERDMKSVSEGNKSKAEVLATSLQQMKACFLDARLNKVKLLEAMAIFFERSSRSGGDEHHATGEIVRRCGLCQESDMVLKKNRDGNFMVGCLGFPQCRNAVWLPGSVSEAVVTTNTCNFCTPVNPPFLPGSSKINYCSRGLNLPSLVQFSCVLRCTCFKFWENPCLFSSPNSCCQGLTNLPNISLNDRSLIEFLHCIKTLVGALPVKHLDVILEGLPQEYDPIICLLVTMQIEEIEGLILARELRLQKYKKKSLQEIPLINIMIENWDTKEAPQAREDFPMLLLGQVKKLNFETVHPN
ncbi:DNA topoisomerase 3-alpha, partial [Mucuna pruriens]